MSGQHRKWEMGIIWQGSWECLEGLGRLFTGKNTWRWHKRTWFQFLCKRFSIATHVSITWASSGNRCRSIAGDCWLPLSSRQWETPSRGNKVKRNGSGHWLFSLSIPAFMTCAPCTMCTYTHTCTQIIHVYRNIWKNLRNGYLKITVSRSSLFGHRPDRSWYLSFWESTAPAWKKSGQVLLRLLFLDRELRSHAVLLFL